MITRMWRGWTPAASADAYERLLLDELFPALRSIPGFRGAEVLRRRESDAEVAFVTLLRFDTLQDVEAFAGEHRDRPVIEPRAAELLARLDEQAVHYETRSFLP